MDLISPLVGYLWYLGPASVTWALATWFLRDRVRWSRVDHLWFFFPGVIWIVLVVIDDGDRSLANFIELPLLGLLCFPFVLLRVALQSWLSPQWAGFSVLAMAVLSAVAVWAFFPGLPE